MLPRPAPKVVQTIKSVMPTMTRVERRRFQAQVVIDHCDGNQNKLPTELVYYPPYHTSTILSNIAGASLSETLERGVVDGLENGSRVDEKYAVVRHRTQCV